MNFLSSQRPILSPLTILNFPSQKNTVPTIPLLHQSSLFMFPLLYPITVHTMYCLHLKWILRIYRITFNHPNFSILIASNNCIKVNVKFSLYKPWRYTGRVEVQQNLKISGATPPLPILMACTGMTLRLP
jgi:hypothetical protein